MSNKNAKLCKRCSGKMKIKKCEVSRERLKFEIRYFPITTVGKIHSVSDNTIRKWCKKYNLPFRSKEILEISDEDWAKI